MRRILKVTVVVSLAAALAAVPLACGDSNGGNGDGSDKNYVAREAITGALESEKELDSSALDVIARVKAGQYDLREGLDDVVDQTRVLTSLIIDVAAPDKPPDTNLAEVQALTEEYLRNRVHQLERALSAQSGEELESLYMADKAELDGTRNQITRLLIIYSPDLEKTIQ
ncbi:MAG: hypothetical protein KKE79_02655 [Actinobacteria bacterium]|nr:hypothetical protein [Actinomycetota bacterium]MBU4240014.1 hypothetical protein [Actinomycetota bacterium]MBU4301720.1 hypothetical protein [Actinomycetota bacterium]MBU4386763.1 hypothetical protein [Actinomycetota bacterium]MBU4489515.1 hypothetical protein [Actinomycetota bacterium]